MIAERAIPELEPIARDLPCVQCDYNLRGLKPDGDCPECGKAISLSVADDQPGSSFYPKWVERSHRRVTMAMNLGMMEATIVPLLYILSYPPPALALMLLFLSGTSIFQMWTIMSSRRSGLERPRDRQAMTGLLICDLALMPAYVLPIVGYLIGRPLLHVSACVGCPLFVIHTFLAIGLARDSLGHLGLPSRRRQMSILMWVVPLLVAWVWILIIRETAGAPPGFTKFLPMFGLSAWSFWKLSLMSGIEPKLKDAIRAAGPYAQD